MYINILKALEAKLLYNFINYMTRLNCYFTSLYLQNSSRYAFTSFHEFVNKFKHHDH